MNSNVIADVPFHHAFPVSDIATARTFYADVLGCPIGRESSDVKIDFNFFGHHIVAQLVTGDGVEIHRRAAEGRSVAVRHFGVVVPRDVWNGIVDRLKGAGATFVYGPEIRHKGHPNEEALTVVTDPSGNGLEFKSLADNYFLFHKD